MQTGWIERGDSSCFVAELEGIDVERRDAAEPRRVRSTGGFDFQAWRRRIVARLQFSAPADLARFTDRFTITIDSTGLSLAGAKPGASALAIPLSDVIEIRGGRRISLHHADGFVRELPCSLLDLSQHAAFAVRLDEAARRLRAASGVSASRSRP